MEEIASEVNKTLLRLKEDGGDYGFVIFKLSELANYYLQFRFQDNARELYGECVSNHYLVNEHAIGDVSKEILDDAGWIAPPDDTAGNYRQTVAIRSQPDLEEVAAQTAMVMMSVFGVERLGDVTVNLYLGPS